MFVILENLSILALSGVQRVIEMTCIDEKLFHLQFWHQKYKQTINTLHKS